MSRRRFLAASAVAAAVGPRLLEGTAVQAAEFKTKLKKALIGAPTEETLTAWKEAGFDGIEAQRADVSPESGKAVQQMAERVGMRIHAVLYGWANFNHAHAFNEEVAKVASAIESTGNLGATAMLLVPCRVGGMAMPEAWEFDIEFNESTGHVTKVFDGDNAPYQEYMAAHNQATDATRKAVEKLIPVAEKAGVVIALENVWNNLWVKPAIFKHLVASFDNPWVQAYFDIGNHVKYAPAEEWIRTLGKLIVRCHVKDFQLNPDGHGGKFVDIRDGSVNWPVVRRELDNLGLDEMWMTIEGSGGLSLEERSKRLDLIIAGK
ncbi:MAG: sugar phosphate isomerase/epimerase family protein [Thermoguttaceae bacterium]|jgi:hexulose-6-phosphate isomerase|nr:sugar phosphate isomerase/epimerase family protein [Thermoguttaceae bacterium]